MYLKYIKTFFYIISLHQSLHAGTNKLRRPGFDCQIKVKHSKHGVGCLVYKEESPQKNQIMVIIY